MSDPRPTKAERREEARLQALRMREEQERTAKRQRTIVLTALGVGLVVIAAVIVYIFSLGESSGGPTGPLAEIEPTVSTDRGGIMVDEEGVVADPPAAAEASEAFGEDVVVVSVYSDYMCPYCGLFEQTAGSTLDQLRESGEVVVDYHPVSILDGSTDGGGFSTRAASAAFHVAEEAPEAFVSFNALLFAAEPSQDPTGLSDAEVAEIAEQAGVPEDVVAELGNGDYRWWAAQATQLATEDLGQLSTPTILLDGEPLEADWRQPGALEAAIAEARG
jgi:protein-disulfide isomerase